MQYKIGGRIKENIWRNQNRYFISTFREKFRYPKDNFSRTRVDFGYKVLPKVMIKYMPFLKINIFYRKFLNLFWSKWSHRKK